MDVVAETLRAALQNMMIWEGLAVVLGIAYLLLAMRENIACWYAAFVSTTIFLVLFWKVSLLMESALQAYYMAMAVYGWYHWRSGGGSTDEGLPISRWRGSTHVAVVTGILVVSAVSGYLLTLYSGARLPYVDSLTTWGSVFTTWMVARKILENWLYWIVIDSVSLVLYVDRELYLTALLFVAYLVIAGFGYVEWLRHFRRQHERADR